MKRLSRNDIEVIAEKYVKAYLELPEIKSAQVYRIEPEIMLEKVLGLNVEYMHLSYDGSILGMTSFGELGVQVFENDDEEAFFFLDGKTVLVESDLNYDNKSKGRKNFILMHEGSHQIFKMLFPNDYGVTQPPEYIAKSSVEQFKHYQEAARGHIRYVTLAPEHDEGFALTHYLTEHGVVVSIGHSAATYEQAVMAWANGARSMTHVYNGMSPFTHRANGLVGAAYRIRTMYGEIICDGCHSTPAALNNYFMSKGPDYAIMISDALMAKGTPIGSEYIFGGNHITIYPDGCAPLYFMSR